MISDLDAYRRAVQFYFPNAEVEFVMNVKLTGAAPTAEEMQKPASIKPQEPAAPRPAAPAKPKKEPAAKPAPKPKKAKEDKPVKEYDHCLTGETLVETDSGPRAIKDLVGTEGMLWSYDAGQPVLMPYHSVRQTQTAAEIYEVELEDGRVVTATGDHPFLTERGWVQVKDLRETDRVICIEEGANAG